jgi:hypothetical protein
MASVTNQEPWGFFLALFSARFSAIVFVGFFFVSLRMSWPLPMGFAPYG